jgi:hypothetical protein
MVHTRYAGSLMCPQKLPIIKATVCAIAFSSLFVLDPEAAQSTFKYGPHIK